MDGADEDTQGRRSSAPACPESRPGLIPCAMSGRKLIQRRPGGRRMRSGRPLGRHDRRGMYPSPDILVKRSLSDVQVQQAPATEQYI
jgi:hypothetical protein